MINESVNTLDICSQFSYQLQSTHSFKSEIKLQLFARHRFLNIFWLVCAIDPITLRRVFTYFFGLASCLEDLFEQIFSSYHARRFFSRCRRRRVVVFVIFRSMYQRSCFQTFDVHDKHRQCCIWKQEKSVSVNYLRLRLACIFSNSFTHSILSCSAN